MGSENIAYLIRHGACAPRSETVSILAARLHAKRMAVLYRPLVEKAMLRFRYGIAGLSRVAEKHVDEFDIESLWPSDEGGNNGG